jgi:AraC-like DNA-binding protein
MVKITSGRFQCRIPQKPLSDFVSLFWYWQGHDSSGARERILPSATTELVIKLGRSRTSDAGVCGPNSRFSIIERSHDELLGAHFKEGGAFPFFTFPIAELHNLGSSLTEVWGHKKGSELIQRVNEPLTIEGKFRVLEQWLLRSAPRPLQHHRGVVYAMKEFQRDSAVSCGEMAAKVGFSQRHFIELFRQETGLSPKRFCRVKRFQQVIQAIQDHNLVDWADVAVAFQYHDQAHLIHEFQQLSGLTPTEYLPLRTAHLNHVKVLS